MNWIKGNGFVKALFVVLMTTLTIMPVLSVNPVYNGGVWYSLYQAEQVANDVTFDVFAPCQSTLSYKCHKQAWATGTFTIYVDEVQKYSAKSSSFSTSYGDYTLNSIPENTSKVRFDKTGGMSLYYMNITIPLKQHVRLRDDDNSTYGTDELTREFGSNTLVGQTKEETIYLRSFLTSDNLMMKVVPDDGDGSNVKAANEVFKIIYNNQTCTTEVAITNNGNICGYPDASTSSLGTPQNTSSMPIIIQYCPDKIELRKAKLVFYDGTYSESNIKATVHLTANTVNYVSNGKPYYAVEQSESGEGSWKWFSAYYNWVNPQSVPEGTDDIRSVYPPCVTENCTIKVQSKCTSHAYTKFRLYLYHDSNIEVEPKNNGFDNEGYGLGNRNENGYGSNIYTWGWFPRSAQCKEHPDFLLTNPVDYENTYQVKVSSPSTGLNYNNLQIKLADHILLDDGTKFGTTNRQINVTLESTDLGKQRIDTIKFRSFLTTREIKIKRISGDPNVFRVKNSSTMFPLNTDCTLLSSQSGAYQCGINQSEGGDGSDYVGSSTHRTPGNASLLDIPVYFYPTGIGTYTAEFQITDGVKTVTAKINITISNTSKHLNNGSDHTTFIEQLTSGGKPYYAESTWFSLYQGKYNGNYVTLPRPSNSTIAVYPPCKLDGQNIKFTFGGGGTDDDNRLAVAYNDSLEATYSGGATSYHEKWKSKDYINSTLEYTDKLPQTNIYCIQFHHTAATDITIQKMQIALAYHALIDNGTTFGATSATINYNDESPTIYVGESKYDTFKLRSFLTESGLEMKIEGANSSMFKIKKFGTNDVSSTEITEKIIAQTGNICGFPGGNSTTDFGTCSTSVNTSDLPIVIEYCPTAAGNHTATLVFYDGTNQRATVSLEGTASQYETTLEINGDNEMYRHETQTLTFKTNDTESRSITLTTSDESVISVDNDNHSLTALSNGNATITATINSSAAWTEKSATLDVEVVNAVMTFNGGSDSYWFNLANWKTVGNKTPVAYPDASDDVQIAANCLITDETNAVCNDMTFSDGTVKLSVDSMSTLVASGSITTQSDNNLYLRANLNKSASVLFTSGSPKATVECYFKGNPTTEIKNEGQTNQTTTITPEWQYRGFIGDPDATGWFTNDNKAVLVYEWSEANKGWNTGKDGDGYVTQGVKWKGYSMGFLLDNDHRIQTYTTTLLPTGSNHTLTNLTYTQGKGLNLVTNSFSAPVKIKDITFTNVNGEIAFFKTNSYQTVKGASDKTSFYQTYPLHTGTVTDVEDCIPAGASFFCLATGSSPSMTLPAPQSQASGAMYAPREQVEFNVLKIYAESESERDEVYLVESDRCSHNYDDGYDGTKYFTDGMGQIYGKNDFGRTFIAADSSMLGQMIGFKAGSNDMTYTLRFDTERLTGYDELYLYDRVTKQYVNILEGSSYYFTGSTDGEDERFQIIGRMEDSDSFITGSDHALEVVADRALLRGFDGEDETICMTDLAGKVVWSDNAKNGPWFNLPTNIASGLYIIHCGDATAKYLKR